MGRVGGKGHGAGNSSEAAPISQEQSSKECYGKELVYADECEFLQDFEQKGYEVSDVTERVAVGEQPMFFLEKLG